MSNKRPMTIKEQIERNNAILLREYQRGFADGGKDMNEKWLTTREELIGELLEDIVFYLENKKNHNDKFYVYWSEMRKKWEEKLK